ncbi:hypothetical protein [Streptomyces sp. NPDC054863]
MSGPNPDSTGSPTPVPPTPAPAPPQPHVPPSPTPPPTPSSRRLGEWAAVVSALAGVAGVLLGFFGLPTVLNSPTARASAPAPQPTVTVTHTVGTGPASQAPPDTAPPVPNPTILSKANIRMPTDFYILLADNPIQLHAPDGPRGDIIYNSFNGLESRGNLVKLDPGQKGSLEECKADTRYTNIIRKAALTKGSRICVLSRDHVALVTVREGPQTRDDGDFLTIDLTVWP